MNIEVGQRETSSVLMRWLRSPTRVRPCVPAYTPTSEHGLTQQTSSDCTQSLTIDRDEWEQEVFVSPPQELKINPDTQRQPSALIRTNFPPDRTLYLFSVDSLALPLICSASQMGRFCTYEHTRFWFWPRDLQSGQCAKTHTAAIQTPAIESGKENEREWETLPAEIRMWTEEKSIMHRATCGFWKMWFCVCLGEVDATAVQEPITMNHFKHCLTCKTFRASCFSFRDTPSGWSGAGSLPLSFKDLYNTRCC